MKRPLTLLLCLLVCLLPALASALTEAELDQQVDTAFSKSRAIGGVLAVIRYGEILYQRAYGYEEKATLDPVTEDTYFRIASVTKMVSGIGLMQLVERGLLDLDQDISDYFGYPIANTYYPDTPITLRQLMSHTSTLSIAGGYGSNHPIYEMLSEAVRRRGNYTEDVPGSVYAYSNFGAGVAGAILEAVTGKSVNRYMTDHVFAPLQIDASYDPATLHDPDAVATLYNTNGTR